MTLSVISKPTDLTKGIEEKQKRFKDAFGHTANKLAKEIRDQGREDISTSGNFQNKFIKAFYAFAKRHTGATVITVGSHIPFFNVFEKGGVIKGAPLLWIPIEGKDLPRASKYEAQFGQQLIQITGAKGTPLLVVNPEKQRFGKGARRLKRKAGEILYFGVTQVTEKKLFNIRAIVEEEAKQTAAYLHRYMNEKT